MKGKLIALVVLLVIFNFSLIGQVKNNDEIIKVEFCELLINPKKYADKIVETKAFYVVGLESAWVSKTCEYDYKNKSIHVEFDENWKKNSSPKSISKFEKGLKFKDDKIGQQRSVKITFIGLFKFIRSEEDNALAMYKLEISFLK